MRFNVELEINSTVNKKVNKLKKGALKHKFDVTVKD